MPYPQSVVRTLRQGPVLSIRTLSALHVELGERFATAAKRLTASARVAPRQVAVIGSHGHTIYHGPRDAVPSTLQIGSAAVIAQRTGIAVVSDFRSHDLAAGGEGAPLVPYFDKTFFGNGPVRALQNEGTRRFTEFQRETVAKFHKGELSQKEAQLAIEHFWAGALRRAVIDGDVETGSLMAGQSVGMVSAEQPMAEILEELVDQATSFARAAG